MFKFTAKFKKNKKRSVSTISSGGETKPDNKLINLSGLFSRFRIPFFIGDFEGHSGVRNDPSMNSGQAEVDSGSRKLRFRPPIPFFTKASKVTTNSQKSSNNKKQASVIPGNDPESRELRFRFLIPNKSGHSNSGMTLVGKKVFSISVFLTLVLLIVSTAFYFLTKSSGNKAEASWFNDNWGYRQQVIVTNNTSAESDVYISFDGADVLDTSDTDKFQSDCGDIRFTNQDGVLLNYYIVSGCGTSSTDIDVLLENFKPGSQTIYMYYSNPYIEDGIAPSTFSTEATNYSVGTPASEEIGPGPISNWTFDENFGQTAYDQFGRHDLGWSAPQAATTTNTITTSTNEGAGDNHASWNHRVFYDINTNRYHIVYIDSGGNMHTQSTDSGSGATWVDGVDVNSNTVSYDNFSCVIDSSTGASYLHCVSALGTDDVLSYNRCSLLDSSPYISCSSTQEIYNASDEGGASQDDIEFPKVALDSNRCLLVASSVFDQSETVTERYEVWFFKEASPCGDGSWTHESGFPQEDIASELGYVDPAAVGLESFGDLDAQIYWVDTATSGTYQLETIHFDGDTNTLGTQVTMDTDIEGTQSNFNNYSVVIGDASVTFGMDDGSTDLDAYIISSRGGTSTSQVDTNIDTPAVAGVSVGTVTAVVDTNAPGGDDIWVFAQDSGNNDDIVYNVSTDGGSTWSGTDTLWVDTFDTTEVKHFSATYNEENCDILVSWLGNTSSPFNVNSKVISTGNCPLSPALAPNWGVGVGSDDPVAYLEFDGAGEYLIKSDDNDFDFGTSSFTLEGWFKHPTAITGTDILLSKHNEAGYKVYMDSNGYLCFGVDDDSTFGPDDAACSTTSYADSNWYHFVAVKNGTSSIQLYVNGELVAEDTSLAATGTLDNSDPLYFAIDSDGTSNSWEGYFYNFYIYPYARTANEVYTSYTGFESLHGAGSMLGAKSPQNSLDSRLIGYWKLDESSGDAEDSSDNNNTLTNNGTTTFLGGRFDNASEHVPASSQHFSTATTINNINTVSFWVNPDNTTNYYFSLTSGAYLTSTAGTLSATGLTDPTIYVNGEQSTSIVADEWQLVTVVSDTSINASQFYIGRQGSNYFDGSLDDFRLYSRSLSTPEVEDLYAWGPSPVLEWKFDENSGIETTNDTSGNENTGYFSNDITEASWVPGVYGSAISLDTSKTVTALDKTDGLLDFGSNDSFSINAWVKLTAGTGQIYESIDTYYFTSYDAGTAWADSPANMVDGSNSTFADNNGNDDDQLNNANTCIGACSTQTSTITKVEMRIFGCQDSGDDGDLILTPIFGGVTTGDDYTWTDVTTSGSCATSNYDSGWYDITNDSNAPTWDWSEIQNIDVNVRAERQGGADVLYASILELRVTAESTDNPGGNLATKFVSGEPGYSLYDDTSNNICFAIDDDSAWNPDDSACTSGINYFDDEWHHVAAVKDDSNGIYLYIDGVLVASDTSLSATGSLENTAGFVLGNSYNGVIDNLQVHQFALNSKQVVNAMNARLTGEGVANSPNDSPVLHLKFDEGYGTTANDSSPSSNNFTLSSASWDDAGHLNKAFSATGATYLSRSDDNSLDFTASQDFTVTGWVKSSGASNPGGNEYIYNKSASSAGYAVYFNSSGELVFGVDDDATWNPDDLAGDTADNIDYYDSEWHHFVAVKKGTQYLKMYVDGNLVDTDSSIAATGSLANAATSYIGDSEGFNDGDEFRGLIDEFKIYNYALNEQEVNVELNQAKAVVLGSYSTVSGNVEGSWAGDRSYCVPGSSETCNPPVAEYLLNENTGTSSTQDTSESNHTGTLVSITSSSWSPGAKGSGLYLDGSADYIDIGAGPTAVRTVSFWVKPASTTEYFINITGTSDYISSSSGTISATGFSSPTIYVNGLQSTTIVADEWQHVVVTTSTAENASNFDIGRTQNSNYLQGYIDEVRLYSNELSQAQVAWEYSRGLPVSHWKFDECEGTTIYDSGVEGLENPRGNNGTLNVGGGGAVTSVGTCGTGSSSQAWGSGATGKFEASLGFGGSDDYVLTSDPIISDYPFTLSGWIKTSTSSNMEVVSIDDTGSSASVGVRVSNSGNAVLSIESSGADTITGTLDVADGNWHHIVAVYTSATDRLLYVDGLLEGSDTDSKTLPSSLDQVNIGRTNIAGSPTNYFTGQIDNIQIFNYALTEAQVHTIFNNGAVRFD